ELRSRGCSRRTLSGLALGSLPGLVQSAVLVADYAPISSHTKCLTNRSSQPLAVAMRLCEQSLPQLDQPLPLFFCADHGSLLRACRCSDADLCVGLPVVGGERETKECFQGFPIARFPRRPNTHQRFSACSLTRFR